MAEKRKRSSNFTAHDKMRLVKLINYHRDTLQNKSTNSDSNAAKYKSWIAITRTFNSSSTVWRCKESLIKLWDKLKTEGRHYHRATNKNALQADGPSLGRRKVDRVLQQVCSIMGLGNGHAELLDSDNSLSSLPDDEEKVKPEDPFKDTNDADDEETPCKAMEESLLPSSLREINEEVPEIEEVNDAQTYIPSQLSRRRPPLLSRKRPRATYANDRGRYGSLSATYKNVNRKKDDIEKLKKVLLQEEIDYKRTENKLKIRLLELRVESARLDLQMKRDSTHR